MTTHFAGLIEGLRDDIERSFVTPVLEYFQIPPDHRFENVGNNVGFAVPQKLDLVEARIELADLRKRLGQLCLLKEAAHDVRHFVRQHPRGTDYWIFGFLVLYLPVQNFVDVWIFILRKRLLIREQRDHRSILKSIKIVLNL